jgi:4-alpha-glucanotransferase
MSLSSKRTSGILCHFTSLPTPYGVGDFGPISYKFIDKLVSGNQTYWQVLPIGNTGGTGCPYATDSAFGCADYLISPELLINDYDLNADAFNKYFLETEKIDFHKITVNKRAILESVYTKFKPSEDYYAFLDNEKSWLAAYCTFRALYETRGLEWTEWPSYNVAQDCLTEREKFLVEYNKFVQFTCFQQLSALKKYANTKNIKLIGDLPIFVSYYSMDVWQNPEQFVLNKDTLDMDIETGAAPDGFSATGQKWGTPIYDWEYQKRNKYQWWNDRLGFLKRYHDVVRIDHFRGFCDTWVSKLTEPDASGGYWYPGPRADLFNHLTQTPEIIAEDLGHITQDVYDLRDQFNFPGMTIFQFMLGDSSNPHKMINHSANSIFYSGTHDNDTLMGWFNSLTELEKSYVESELDLKNPDNWMMLAKLMESKANMVIIQVQDLLALGTEARFNYPGTVQDTNWTWKLTSAQFEKIDWVKLSSLTATAKRAL